MQQAFQKNNGAKVQNIYPVKQQNGLIQNYSNKMVVPNDMSFATVTAATGSIIVANPAIPKTVEA